MYFIQKEAIYPHGVFWIGRNKKEGIKECDRLAAIDCDDWHTYKLYEFGILNRESMPNGGNKSYVNYEHDPEHKLIYKARKE